MRNPIYLSLLCLSLSVFACGKSSNSGGQVGVQAISPTNGGGPYMPPPSTSGMTLQQYCQMNYGQYNGSTCSITSNYNVTYSGIGDLPTSISVYVGQRVGVSISGSARILVGGMVQATGSATFVSQNSGYLSFQKYSSFYSVQSVQVTTCLGAVNQTVVCP